MNQSAALLCKQTRKQSTLNQSAGVKMSTNQIEADQSAAFMMDVNKKICYLIKYLEYLGLYCVILCYLVEYVSM